MGDGITVRTKGKENGIQRERNGGGDKREGNRGRDLMVKKRVGNGMWIENKREENGEVD